MFDIGGWELLVIGSLALIIVGPKDLPRMIRNVGQWVGKARGLAREFQSGMEQAAREADLDDVAKAGRGLRDTVSSLGAETKRMLDSPATPSAATPPEVDEEREPPRPPSPPVPPRPAGAVLPWRCGNRPAAALALAAGAARRAPARFSSRPRAEARRACGCH